MAQQKFVVTENTVCVQHCRRLRLQGDTGAMTNPGQYGLIRQPVQGVVFIADWDDEQLTVYYDDRLSLGLAFAQIEPGQEVELTLGLGNGFAWEKSSVLPVLVGSGIEAAPLLALGRVLAQNGRMVTAVLEFANKEQVFLAEELRSFGVEVFLATADGSVGMTGSAKDVLEAIGVGSGVYVSGPEDFLLQIHTAAGCSGEYLLSSRLHCGEGKCGGCDYQTPFRVKKLCQDGPVLTGGELMPQ